ncbi:hypothetical protein CYD30_00660 [Kosakonia cowanii]|nr:hypothetical protein CYD30_00660 [Kosakonia cowanii]
MTRIASSLCRAYGYASMAGRAGASQDAPVSSKAGKTNSVRSAAIRLVSWVVAHISLTGGCPYGYDPYPDSPIPQNRTPLYRRLCP